MIKIPTKIKYVIDAITKNGYEAYIVGGCVRDTLMGKTPHDFDVTTSALPEKIEEIFEKTVPTGIKHGTITVVIDKYPIEVTTFRSESGYKDSRHPDRVDFVTSLEADLSRRDFTVNAIAYNSEKGIIDYFGGIEDINNKTLRAVGNPEIRFQEDALRILRLFRFSSVLNFKCEENTLNAALKYIYLLNKISSERIFQELYKAVIGENFKSFEPLILCGGLEFLKICKVPDFNVIKSIKSTNLAFFAFLFYSSSDISETLNILKVSNRLKNYCISLANLVSNDIPNTAPEIKILLCNYPPDILKDYLKFKQLYDGTDTSNTQKILCKIIENNEPYRINDLKINGSMLKKMGFSGEEIGVILKKLQMAVINEPMKNEKEILIKEILP